MHHFFVLRMYEIMAQRGAIITQVQGWPMSAEVA
jgi:hypothetical protein